MTTREQLKPKPSPRLVAVNAPPCRWPIGDPGEPGFRFCEAPAVEGRPYCGAHSAKAYVRAPLKRLSP